MQREPIRRGCHANLKPGEYKRVPKPLAFPPVGFYFGCLACGWMIAVRTKFINEREGLAVLEREGKLMELETVECEKCGHRFAVRGGEYVDP